MNSKHTGSEWRDILSSGLDSDSTEWLEERLHKILSEKSGRDLFLTYSLIAGRVKDVQPESYGEGELAGYLASHDATLRQIARMYLLVRVLEEDRETFSPRVAKLIQVADKSELETFLRYLSLLPEAGDFKDSAVEALRTNIATVFDAISLDNPYPATYFNDQQWNQMYLKAAFMQRDLSRIQSVGQRANADLTRIISDYAHERWAASRDVDPMFWRPVTNYITGVLVEDMKRLLDSDSEAENKAGALCCFYSENEEASKLLENYTELRDAVADEKITWQNLNK